METVVQVPVNPLYSQLLVLVIILFVFFFGVLVRSWWDKDKLSMKQYAAAGIIVFITISLPLASIVHNAFMEANSLYVVLTACIPPFMTGVTSREQIKKVLRG